MAERLKTSLGIWAFGPLATRFLVAGYHPEVEQETPVDRARRVAEGLHDLYDGLEFHYPNEIDEENAQAIVDAIKPMDVYCIASGAHTFPRHGRGALTNPDQGIREEAKAANRGGIDLAARLGAHMIIWPGIEGYNYPFQADYQSQWKYFIDDVAARLDEDALREAQQQKDALAAYRAVFQALGMSSDQARLALGTPTAART